MKGPLFEILKNPNDKLICVDMDGTLCFGEFWGRPDDPEPAPNMEMIELVRDLYMKGALITIFTARQWRMAPATDAWLRKHEVPFHGLNFLNKPGADLYIDDKTLNTEDIFPGAESPI